MSIAMFKSIYYSDIQDSDLSYCHTLVLVATEFGKAQQLTMHNKQAQDKKGAKSVHLY